MRQALFAYFAVILGLSGCGGDEAEVLEGQWMAEIPGKECVVVLAFTGAIYEADTVCVLRQSGNTGLEAEVGTFTATGGKLSTVPSKTTCATATPATSSYKLEPGMLTVVTVANVLVMRRPPPPSNTSTTAVFGCYNGDAFTPGPIHAL